MTLVSQLVGSEFGEPDVQSGQVRDVVITDDGMLAAIRFTAISSVTDASFSCLLPAIYGRIVRVAVTPNPDDDDSTTPSVSPTSPFTLTLTDNDGAAWTFPAVPPTGVSALPIDSTMIVHGPVELTIDNLGTVGSLVRIAVYVVRGGWNDAASVNGQLVYGYVMPSTTGDTELYSNDTGSIVGVKTIVVCNTTGAAKTFKIGIDQDGGSALSDYQFYDQSLAANQTLVITMPLPIKPGGKVLVQASLGAAVAFTLGGGPWA